MKLLTFSDPQGSRIGILDNGSIADVTVADPGIPREMLVLIAGGPPALERVREARARAPRIPLVKARLLAPIPRSAKNIFCVGKNYHEHAKEFHASGFDASAGAAAIPDVPIIFSKAATTVIGPHDAVPASLDPTQSVDYENELAVVIGKGGRGIVRSDAYSHVFGYTIVNDVTSRTLQQHHKQWFIGKNIDGFCPMGPVLLTRDKVADVGAMHLTTTVNGELRQDAYVRDLIFDIPALIETISTGMTLEPGDIIATGTPAGVGIGFNPPKYLRQGDRVSLTIEPIGTLENPIA